MKTIKEGFLRKNLGLGKEALIKKWLDSHEIKYYTINTDFTIDVDRDVDLGGYKEECLPDYIRFGEVIGGFYMSGCSQLKSLKGCPQEVGYSFYCNECSELTSLEGCPKKVGGDFNCADCNGLKSLKGAPQEVDGKFDCDCCTELESLEGAPREVGGYFSCIGCSKLESLKGAPQKVGGYFDCRECGERFTLDDVKKACKVKGGLYV